MDGTTSPALSLSNGPALSLSHGCTICTKMHHFRHVFWMLHPLLEGVAPATPRREKRAPQAVAAKLRRGIATPIRPRAARDTCAPRAMIRRLINRNPLTIQYLRSCPARGARGSRDTSAAQRLSSDFSYLPVLIGSIPPPSEKSRARSKRFGTCCAKSKIHRRLHSISCKPYTIHIPNIRKGRFCFWTVRASGVRGGRSVGKIGA